MTQTDLEIFLAITRYKTINKAADSLFLAPSTVGTHLKSLEEEFGVQLIERKKGIKSIILTDAGIRFERIAAHMLSLINECKYLNDYALKPFLTIATADSLLEHNLIPFYKHILYTEKLFKLEIRKYSSEQIYPLVVNKEVDIGFAITRLVYPDVEAMPLFSDDAVVVVPADSGLKGESVHPSMLDPEKELFVGSTSNANVGWGAAFNTWRRSVINTEKQPLLSVNNVSVLSYFLDSGDFWTFLPRTIATGYCQTKNLRILEIDGYTPKRPCYMITNKNSTDRTKRSVETFKKLLDEYLKLAHFNV